MAHSSLRVVVFKLMAAFYASLSVSKWIRWTGRARSLNSCQLAAISKDLNTLDLRRQLATGRIPFLNITSDHSRSLYISSFKTYINLSLNRAPLNWNLVMSTFDIKTSRDCFPALKQPQVFFDNAGGSQTLGTVIEEYVTQIYQGHEI